MNIDNIIQQVKDLQAAYHKQAQDLISPAFSSLVKGQIKGFRFTAYTPYFNDGEECTYRVGDPYFALHKDPAKMEPGEEVRINALETLGKITAVTNGMVTVKLSNGRVITLPVSEVTLTATEGDDFEESSWSFTGELKEQAKKIEKFIENIPEDVIKDIFDDHVEITVYADRIEVKEYQHE